MDLNPLVNAVFDIAASAAVPCAYVLISRFATVLEAKLNVTLDAEDEKALADAVGVGVGLLRAKLASGQMALGDIHLSNPHVDAAATIVVNGASAIAERLDMKKADIAQRIVASLGHMLGDDPTVPSVAPTVTPTGPVATSTPIPYVHT